MKKRSLCSKPFGAPFRNLHFACWVAVACAAIAVVFWIVDIGFGESFGSHGVSVALGLALVLAGISSISALKAFYPLRRLNEWAYRFSQGDWDRPPPNLKGPKEIDAVVQAFDAIWAKAREKIEQLDAARTQIESILHTLSEGVLAIGSDGELLFFNTSARQMLGMAPSVKPGHRIEEVVRHPEMLRMIRTAFQSDSPITQDVVLYAPIERHLRIQTIRSQYLKAELVSGSMPPPSNPLFAPQPAVLMTLNDISDLKRLEQIRREFVANVSHELKSPLTVIQAAVETLLAGAAEDRPYREKFLSSIQEETSRLIRLVEDLLALAQVEAQHTLVAKESVSIPSFLEAEVSRYQPLAKAHKVDLTCTTDLPEADLTILANRNQLAQALGNLLDNAIKYNRPGGTVKVRASKADRMLRLEIEDTGIGIPQEDLPRIFERFYRVDKARSRQTGGTGLGLSIVKHVAEAHGGSVQVESQLGKGSRFTLTIPLA